MENNGTMSQVMGKYPEQNIIRFGKENDDEYKYYLEQFGFFYGLLLL